MSQASLTPEQIQQFNDNGYLIVEDVFSSDEIERIRDCIKTDPKLAADAKTNKNYEGEGIGTFLVYRENLSDDIYSAYVQSHRIVAPLQQLFEDDIKYYYHLTMLKNPNTGGWQWHQDYGYHYKEFFYPKFISVMFALDPATKENGCLRVLKGSNHLGRLEHQQSGSQLITDPKRAAIALEHMEEVHCEMDAGSIMFFDGNILHASAPNTSEQSRWSFVISYVPASNLIVLPNPPEDLLTPVESWSDEKVDADAQRFWESLQG
ncbi:MAG: phytanoyl-CoA dioxygenase family protein [Candidatus Latescibacteria bacterium]|nr:phytanoyl-CoA dioxygenase family protein [Candidatus Latescibacterota bacterium]MBT4137217.1 phytanoyl-CoA dioxygenase family protein [Candidatus Latescibacterota bacterium]